MIKINPCRGCGRPLIHHRVANLAVRLEPASITNQEAVAEIMAQRTLWMVDQGKVRPARPGEPGPIREHRCRTDARQSGCTAAGALTQPSPVPAPQPTPQRPPAGRTTRSSGPSAAPSSVRSAVQPRSDTRSHPCDGCGKPVELDGAVDYMALELGATVMWAIHDGCGRKY